MLMKRRPLQRRNSSLRDERGAALVLVAVTLPVLILFVAFGIEVGHWYDYSRNLQNRADAAALAAAVQYGSTCFGSPTSADTDVIGKVAQQYAGPPTGDTTAGNLPYPLGSIPIANYKNQPNLTRGAPTDFHMLLNSTQYSQNGGANWNMGTSGHTGDSTALCSSRDEQGNVGAMVDVRLTQANVPLFFPLFGFQPTISAHARAALEGESSTTAAPIAVGDSGFTPCVSVRLVNATTNSVIQTVTLAKEPTNPQNPTAPVQWDNSATPASFTMPNSDNVYLQPYLNDCNGSGQTFDDSTNTGLLMINNHPATDPTVNSGQPPQINSGGVTVTGACTNSTQYFSTQAGGCTVRVNAMVTFANDVTPTNKAKVFLVEHQWNNTTNAWVTTQTQMNSPGNGNGNQCNPGTYCLDVTMPDSNGIDQFSLKWEEDNGKIGTTSCSGNPTPAVCTGDFNSAAILQQAFAACNGCDQPDDSGPVVFSRISEADNSGNIIGNDTNSFAGGSTHNLVFTFKLSGLNTASAGDPPTVLRFANSTNHQTGLVDCGQGNSGSNDSDVVYYGCGPNNPLVPGMNPLFVYSRAPGSDCSPAADGNTTGWPNGNNQDCIQTTPGQRRQLIICPLVERIVGAPYPGNCNGNAPGTCPVNNWRLGLGSAGIQPGDPRAITMIITSEVDLATGNGQPQAWLPIRKFATFYVTGWDSSINPSCTSPSLGSSQNEAFPTKGKRNSQNGAVWGHWITYEDTAGTPNGQLCAAGPTPTNCVPALTR
jgi:hypothetical protein